MRLCTVPHRYDTGQPSAFGSFPPVHWSPGQICHLAGTRSVRTLCWFPSIRIAPVATITSTALYFCLHTATRTDTDKGGLHTAAITVSSIAMDCGRSRRYRWRSPLTFYPIKSFLYTFTYSLLSRYKEPVIITKYFAIICTAFRVTRQDHITSPLLLLLP